MQVKTIEVRSLSWTVHGTPAERVYRSKCGRFRLKKIGDAQALTRWRLYDDRAGLALSAATAEDGLFMADALAQGVAHEAAQSAAIQPDRHGGSPEIRPFAPPFSRVERTAAEMVDLAARIFPDAPAGPVAQGKADAVGGLVEAVAGACRKPAEKIPESS